MSNTNNFKINRLGGGKVGTKLCPVPWSARMEKMFHPEKLNSCKQNFQLFTMCVYIQKCKLSLQAVAASCGAFSPHSEVLPPLAPPVRRKKWPKSAIFGNFFDFCPLRNVFCPLDAPPQKIFWCHHCLQVPNFLAVSSPESYTDQIKILLIILYMESRIILTPKL